MLNNATFEAHVLTIQKIAELQSVAERRRLIASGTPSRAERKTARGSRIVKSILQRTGMALVTTGNRLLKLA